MGCDLCYGVIYGWFEKQELWYNKTMFNKFNDVLFTNALGVKKRVFSMDWVPY